MDRGKKRGNKASDKSQATDPGLLSIDNRPPAAMPGEQVEQVRKWVIAGGSEFEIVEAIRAAYPNSDPAALVLAAMRSFRAAADPDPVIVFGWAVEATRDLYRRQVEAGDYAGALRSVKHLLELSRNVPRRSDTEEDETIEGQDSEIRGCVG